MSVTVRPLSWRDLDVILPLERELFGHEAWDARSWWEELAARPRREYVAAQDGGNLVGYAGIDDQGDVADVMTIAVVPSARRRGIGRVLLDALLARARARGAHDVILEVRADNAAALALYADAGFTTVRTRRGYYRNPGSDPVDALVLRASTQQAGAA